MARRPLQPPRDVDQLPDLGVLLVGLLEGWRLLEGLVEGHLEVEGDHLRDLVHFGVAQVENAPHVTHHRLRLHGPEGDDLGHVLAPVLPGHVLDDLPPAVLAEIDVDVRGADAFLVEEALEDQVVLDGVEVGDAQRVGDEASRRGAPSGPHRDPPLLREADEVPDDQEVSREAHPADHPDLLLEAGLVIPPGVTQAARLRQGAERLPAVLEPVAGDLLEVAVDGEASRHVEGGKGRRAGEREVAPLRHRQGVAQRLRVVGKDPRHLLGALQVELLGVKAEALRLLDLLAGADAEQDVVGVGVVLQQVVGVVGGHEGHPRALSDPGEGARDPPLLLEAVLHDLEEEAAVVEDLPELPHRTQGGRFVSVAQGYRDLAAQAPGQADEAAVVLPQELLVDPGAVVEALGVGEGHQLHEVVVPLVVRREQGQVVVGLGDPRGAPVEAAADRDVDLAAQDRLDPLLPAGVVEGHRPEHVAVVGDGQPLHPEAPGLLDQLVDVARPVEEAVFGVQVQVDELGGRHSHSIVEGGLLEMS